MPISTRPGIAAAFIFAVFAHGAIAGEPEKPASYRMQPASDEQPGPHFLRARELYGLGTSKADEIIVELDLELRDHPESLRALSLKASTQIGTERYAAAMLTLDRFDEITRARQTISPIGILLRARCLYFMGEFAAAKAKLEPYEAFFRDTALKPKYDELTADIARQLSSGAVVDKAH